MMKQMTRRESRFVAVMLLAIMLVVVFILVEPLWSQYVEAEEEIASLSDRLVRFNRLSRERDGLQSNLNQLLSEYESKGYLLKGDTPGLAVADLQSIVQKMIDQSGARLISTQAIGGQVLADHSVSVRVKTEGQISEIKQILEAIETSSMVLLLDNVSVLKNRRKRFNVKGGHKALQLNFDLTAFVTGQQR